jgi:hypothetical protein
MQVFLGRQAYLGGPAVVNSSCTLWLELERLKALGIQAEDRTLRDTVVISDFLRELLRFVILVLIRPVLKVVGAIFSPIYRFLFEGFDNQTHKKLHERLCQGIRQNLPWLFDRYGAKVIPNTRPYPRAFDYAVVTVSAERMLFALFRGVVNCEWK